MSSVRRIAVNTISLSIAEIVTKVAQFIIFVYVAIEFLLGIEVKGSVIFFILTLFAVARFEDHNSNHYSESYSYKE